MERDVEKYLAAMGGDTDWRLGERARIDEHGMYQREPPAWPDHVSWWRRWRARLRLWWWRISEG